jgi:hypothetical protein
VRLGHWDEIVGTKEFTNNYLVPQRLLWDRARFAGQNVLFFIVEVHGSHSIFAPDARTALPHLTISSF